MKIAFFLIDDETRKVIEDKFKDYDVSIFSEALSEDNIEKVLDCEILVSRIVGLDLEFGRDVLSRFENLRFISTMSTGFDHIDLDYCNEHGIVVSNVPSYSEESVAELVFGLLLAVVRIKGKLGVEIGGKVLGVVGSGRIGLKVIEIAKGFGMKVVVYDVVFNEEARKRLGFEYVELDELLKMSDFVSLHAPYNGHTRHMISDNLRLVKKGCVVINTAREGLIDTEVLVELVKSGKISCGLDVVDENFKEELLGMDNVVLTDHIGASTVEAREKVFVETIENVEGFINKEVRNVVNV
tara:strand:+ start:34 stop:924 length:891 start_codon:yes stop_codon:yes gene_type:complete